MDQFAIECGRERSHCALSLRHSDLCLGIEVCAMFSSAALRLAVDFVESLDPPPPRPKVDKAAGAGTFVRAVVEDGREICHESARARDALDLTPLMEEVRTAVHDIGCCIS